MSDRDWLKRRIEQVLTEHSHLVPTDNGWECEDCGYWMRFQSVLPLHQADEIAGRIATPPEADPETVERVKAAIQGEGRSTCDCGGCQEDRATAAIRAMRGDADGSPG